MADENSAAQSPVQQGPAEPTPKQDEPAEPTPSQKEPDCSSFPPPEECEPRVDKLTCTAEGDQAKADYYKTFAEAHKKAKTEYETARKDYRTARGEKRLVIEDLTNQIRHLVERIGCQIEQKRVRKCLDDSFKDILKQLECCPSPDPCCMEECEFPLPDFEQDKTSVEEMTALITEYEARIKKARDCFTELISEPTNFRTRVDHAKTSIDAINAALSGDQAKLDLKKIYADALVAQWEIKLVWGRFPQVQDFVDCLCQALTCWTMGCEAVYELTGAKAVAECVEKRKKEYCDKLRKQTTEQILAAYDKHCAKKECEDSSDDDDNKPDPDDDDDDDDHDDNDCGCHHHHHHHHHHDHERAKGKD
jgi:hypothetical protein